VKLVDLLVYLRNQTVLAELQQDDSRLESLFVALGVIEDAIEAGDDKSYWQVVDDLYNSPYAGTEQNEGKLGRVTY
jgi:hypothetical protein